MITLSDFDCDFFSEDPLAHAFSEVPNDVQSSSTDSERSFEEVLLSTTRTINYIPWDFGAEFLTWVDQKLFTAYKKKPSSGVLHIASFSPFTKVCLFYLEPEITQKYIDACHHRIISSEEYQQVITYALCPEKYTEPLDLCIAQLISSQEIVESEISKLYESACKYRFLQTAKAALSKIEENTCPLHLACKYVFLELIQENVLWQKKFLVYGKTYTTPLHWVAKAQYEKKGLSQNSFIERKKAIIKILLDKGINPLEKDSFGATAFHYSILNGENEILNWMAKTNPLRLPLLADGIGVHHLVATTFPQNKETVTANLMNKDAFGRTSLHYAFSFCKSELSKEDVAFIHMLYSKYARSMFEEDTHGVSPHDILTQRTRGIHLQKIPPRPVILDPRDPQDPDTITDYYGLIEAMKKFMCNEPGITKNQSLTPLTLTPKPVIHSFPIPVLQPLPMHLFPMPPRVSPLPRVLNNLQPVQIKKPETPFSLKYLSQEQLGWMQKTAYEFVSTIIQHWKTPLVQTTLYNLLEQKTGVREFEFTSFDEHFLQPFENFRLLHKNSENHILAFELFVRIGQRTHCISGNTKTAVAPELRPLDFEKDPPLLAFKEILFSYTLHELELYANNSTALFSKERHPDRVLPAYFLHVQDGIQDDQAVLYPLLVQQEMPSKSLLAVGRDSSGLAVQKLRELLSESFPNTSTIQITHNDCETLLRKYNEGKKDFYLFTTPSSSEQLLEKTAKEARLSFAKATTTSILRESTGTRKRSIYDIQDEDETKETPAKKKAKKTASSSLVVIRPKRIENQEIENQVIENKAKEDLPAADTKQLLAQRSSCATPDSLDSLLDRFSLPATEKLQKFSDLSKSQELTLPQITKELSFALSQTFPLPVLQYNNNLLKNYQQEGISWMLDLHKKGLGGVLASEPGLGKTRQAIAFLLQLQKLEPTGRPICVIVPSGIVLQWGEEIQKYLFEEQYTSLQNQVGDTNSVAFFSNLTKLYKEQKSELQYLKTQKEKIERRRFKSEVKKKKAISEIERKIGIIKARKHRVKALIPQGVEISKILAAMSQFATYREYRDLVVLLSQKNQKKASQILQEPYFLQSSKILLCSESMLVSSTSAEFASMLKKIPFACVIIDEAHTFRWKLAQEGITAKTSSSRVLQSLLSTLKTSFRTSFFLLTGTPFINSYEETLSLAQLVNPHMNVLSLALHLNRLASLLSSSLAKSETNNEELMIDPTNYYQALEHAKALQEKLILVHQKSDPKIQAAWTSEDGTVYIPQKDFKPLTCTLTEEQQDILGKQNTDNLIVFNPIGEKIFFHPDLLNEEGFKDKTFQDIVRGSGLLTRLFAEEQELALAIQQKKPTLFFVRQIVVGKALKNLLKMKYPHLGVSFYHGSKLQHKRDALVQRFEDPEDPLKILIISQESGGMGLNLPSAKVVFDLAPWWNEAVTVQAEARALRVGTTGIVEVYAFSYETPIEKGMRLIVERKTLWKEYFFGKPKDPFSCFLHAFSLEVSREAKTGKRLLQKLTAFDTNSMSQI